MIFINVCAFVIFIIFSSVFHSMGLYLYCLKCQKFCKFWNRLKFAPGQTFSRIPEFWGPNNLARHLLNWWSPFKGRRSQVKGFSYKRSLSGSSIS